MSDSRYNLRLPAYVYEELGKIARERGTTRLELIQKFIKLGLLVLQAEEQPDSGFYFRNSGQLERVVIL